MVKISQEAYFDDPILSIGKFLYEFGNFRFKAL